MGALIELPAYQRTLSRQPGGGGGGDLERVCPSPFPLSSLSALVPHRFDISHWLSRFYERQLFIPLKIADRIYQYWNSMPHISSIKQIKWEPFITTSTTTSHDITANGSSGHSYLEGHPVSEAGWPPWVRWRLEVGWGYTRIGRDRSVFQEWIWTSAFPWWKSRTAVHVG